MNYRFILCLAVCLGISLQGAPQTPLSKTFALNEALQNARINQLFNDGEGFIWIASANGLYRFDGLNYIAVDMSDSMKNVTAIGEDPGRGLYIGNDLGYVGLVRKKVVEWVGRSCEAPIRSIAADASGTLWIATYGNGIFIDKKDTLLHVGDRHGLEFTDIYSLTGSGEGNVVAGTDGGLYVLRERNNRIQIENFSQADGLPDNIVLQTAAGDNGKVWVGMYRFGVCLFDPSSGEFTSYYSPGEWRFGQVTALAELNDHLWIGSENQGLIRLDLRTRRLHRLQGDPMPDSEIYSLARDHEGNLWIAHNAENLIHASGFFEYLYELDGQPLGNIHALHGDPQNNLWISSVRGLLSLKTGSDDYGEYTRHSRLPYFAEYPVISIYSDPHGCLWLGTFGMGVIRYNPSTREYVFIKEKDGLINGNVLSISGFDNELWFATLGGVSQCICQPSSGKSYAFTHLDEAAGLGANYIYQVFIDSKKREWFATDGKGVSVLEEGVIKHIAGNDQLENLVALSLTEDDQGGIWFSTSGNGLYKFDGDSLVNFGREAGLSELSISGLAADDNGNLLIINKNGIDLMDVETGFIRYLDHPLLKDMDPDLNTTTRDGFGNIWIGTKHGLLKYNQSSQEYAFRPQIKLDEVNVYPRRKGPDRELYNYNQNHFAFEYVGLWFQDPEKVRYQYMLEGFDMGWNTSTDRTASYPRLGPGDYTFKARASVGPDFSDALVASYSFSIKPPLWREPLFIILLIAVLSGLIFMAVRIRVKRIRNLERLKQEKITFQFEMLKSQVNPHFLFNSFNTLMAIIDEDKDRALEYVENLSDFFRNILIHRDKELIAIEEEIDIIEKYCFLQKRRYESNFEIRIDLSEKIRNGLIAPLTLQILVENAIKHNVISDDNQLLVDLTGENDYIVVKNNLKTKSKVEPSAGIGLQNIKNRYAILTPAPVDIEKSERLFIVKIPVIYAEK